MVFCSLIFLCVFLPPVLAAYFILPRRFRNLVLLLASLVFYAWGEPVYILLMLFSILANFSFGICIEKLEKHKKIVLAFSIVFNLSLLGMFKYANLLIGTINHWLRAGIPAAKLALPIGISFYTFQAMSYVIDVYRKKAPANKNIVSFGTYISMFPQLIAGPIVRYTTVERELRDRKETVDDFSQGIFRFLIGLSKKVILADSMGAVWDQIRILNSGLTTLTAWIGLIAITLQIYLDFSAYSDMAIGLGKMFGFHFMENFDYPYESRSITEFWRRWHISLGTWFKEYVYIPLGGNRCGRIRQIINISVVWLLTGIWHGASWNFLCWGAYYAVLLLMEKIFLRDFLKKIPDFFSRLYTMLVVIIGWGIFSWTEISHKDVFIKSLFFHAPQGFANRQAVFLLLNSAVFFILAIIGTTSAPKKIAKKYMEKDWLIAVYSLAVFVISMAFIVSDTYHPFLYFRF